MSGRSQVISDIGREGKGMREDREGRKPSYSPCCWNWPSAPLCLPSAPPHLRVQWQTEVQGCDRHSRLQHLVLPLDYCWQCSALPVPAAGPSKVYLYKKLYTCPRALTGRSREQRICCRPWSLNLCFWQYLMPSSSEKSFRKSVQAIRGWTASKETFSLTLISS